MQIAYHPNGVNLTTYQLRQWVNASLLDPDMAPNIVIRVTDPAFPYSFGDSIQADDRRTVGGDNFSRIFSVRKRGNLKLNPADETENGLWKAWHLATYGGRIPFLWQEPRTKTWYAVTANVTGIVSTLEDFGYHRPSDLEINEWL